MHVPELALPSPFMSIPVTIQISLHQLFLVRLRICEMIVKVKMLCIVSDLWYCFATFYQTFNVESVIFCRIMFSSRMTKLFKILDILHYISCQFSNMSHCFWDLLGIVQLVEPPTVSLKVLGWSLGSVRLECLW